MLMVVDEPKMRNRISHNFKVFLYNRFIDYKGKEKLTLQ